MFRYFLLLSVVIIPLFVLYKDEEQFPILIGAFLGVTLTYWIAVWIINRRQKTKSRK
ncbi:MAG: hypothetical protein FWF65_05580 [Bacteroidetes bacterium]|nr:hypothetical protein [Bacteroidota bacterium]MCL1969019.1 hypothetical protein [Bacteroidota bacterium]